MNFAAVALLALLQNTEAIDVFAQMDVEKGSLEVSARATWGEQEISIEVTYKNIGAEAICVLKGDIYTEDMWDKYGIYADFMRVRDLQGQKKPYVGPIAGGDILQEYVEIQSGQQVSSKYNLTKTYRVAEDAFSTRNFIFYADCEALRTSALQLETMDYFFGDVADIEKFKRFYTEEYFSLGGRYADSGWIMHQKSSGTDHP